jgi:preprotein translocase subunit SecG
MSTFIILIHVIVCIALILIVLLQTGKGADMGAAFGGGSSQTLFGSTGAATFLSKMTTIAAVVFMLTSLSLAYLSGRRPTSSIMPDAVPVTQEAQEVPAQPREAREVPPQSQAPVKPEAAQPAAAESAGNTATQGTLPVQADEPNP